MLRRIRRRIIKYPSSRPTFGAMPYRRAAAEDRNAHREELRRAATLPDLSCAVRGEDS
jgi:hypothetical protein